MRIRHLKHINIRPLWSDLSWIKLNVQFISVDARWRWQILNRFRIFRMLLLQPIDMVYTCRRSCYTHSLVQLTIECVCEKKLFNEMHSKYLLAKRFIYKSKSFCIYWSIPFTCCCYVLVCLLLTPYNFINYKWDLYGAMYWTISGWLPKYYIVMSVNRALSKNTVQKF